MALTRFTLNGERYELSSDVVEARLADVVPETIRKHAVRVGDAWFPVKQALEVAVGVPRSAFISQTARRLLASLGFEVKGQVAERAAKSAVVTSVHGAAVNSGQQVGEGEWHTEANVQASVAAALGAAGWAITSVANTVTKEHGIDIVAERSGTTVGVEVKGFPSKTYADPSRAHETKRTAPSTQAGHWYAQALLAAMRLRGREPRWRSAVALPDFSRYRNLYAETCSSLDAAQIDVWWVGKNGDVDFGQSR